MNPAFALMDPAYTLTMPLRQLRAGTFDILSHIMETYFSFPLYDNPADDVSEGLMRGLIRDFRAAMASFVGGVVAVILLAVLLGGLLLIQNGSIDEYLQEMQIPEKEEKQQTTAETIDNELLNEAILMNTSKDELVQEPEFSSKKIRKSFEKAIGWDKDRSIIYYDLINDKREEITIETADDEVIGLLRYFPALKKATIKKGDIHSIEAARDCNNLRTLELGYDIFPVTIPKKIKFKVTVLK